MLFNLAAHSAHLPEKEKIRKSLRQGVWMSKLFRKKWHICEPEVIINLWPRKGEAFDAGRIAGPGD